MKKFNQLNVWQKGMELCVLVYNFTERMPSSEKYALISQMQRASVSIVSNIAEGSSRKSRKDFRRFVEMALGSCYELETQLILAKQIYNISEDDLSQIDPILTIVRKQILGLINSLNLTIDK